MNNEQLAALAQQNDQTSLWALWVQVEKLICSKFRGHFYQYGPNQCAAHGVTLDDLYQEGWLAYLDALKAYSPARGWRFTTYLTLACKNRFQAAMGLQVNPRPLDMADSLDRPITDGEADGQFGDLLPDEQAAAELEQVAERLVEETINAALHHAMMELPTTQLEVIRCRFYQQLTRPQTAQQLGITPNEVLREESRALRSLRGDRQVMALDY